MDFDTLDDLRIFITGLWDKFEQTTTFPLVIILLVSVIIIYLLSENISSIEVRVLLILIGVGVAYAVGTNASVIFVSLNIDQVYRDFFLNLSADLFVALFIPLIYVTWFQRHNLFHVFFKAIVLSALFWLVVTYLPPIMDREFKLSRAFLNDLQMEIVAGFVTAVLGICILHVAFLFQSIAKSPVRGDDFVHLGISLISLSFVVVLVLLSTQLPRSIFKTLSVTTVGTIITTILLTSWTTRDKFLYRIVAFVLISASIVLILDLMNYERAFALNLSSEFVGALMTSFLTDGRSI